MTSSHYPEEEYANKKYDWKEDEEAYIFSSRYNVVVKVLLLQKLDDYFWKVGIMRYPTFGFFLNKDKSGPCKPPYIEPFIVSAKELHPSMNAAHDAYAANIRRQLFQLSEEFAEKLEEQRADYLQCTPSQPGPQNSIAQHEREKRIAALTRDLGPNGLKASGEITVNGNTWTNSALEPQKPFIPEPRMFVCDSLPKPSAVVQSLDSTEDVEEPIEWQVGDKVWFYDDSDELVKHGILKGTDINGCWEIEYTYIRQDNQTEKELFTRGPGGIWKSAEAAAEAVAEDLRVEIIENSLSLYDEQWEREHGQKRAEDR